jgi:hypothetical protein
MTKNNSAPALKTTNPSVVENTTDTTTKKSKAKKSRGKKVVKPEIPFDWAKGFETVATQEQQHLYKSELLTAETVKELKSNMDKVIKTIKSGTEHDKEIAKYLFKINGQLKATALEKYKDKKQIKAQVKSAIKELAEQDFHFKPSRAFEYIRLVENGEVFDLNLPISHLIELSRLKKGTDDLKNLLALKTEKELGGMKCREIQALVKEFNTFKRKPKKAKLETAPAPVSEFKKFIGGFDKVLRSAEKISLNETELEKIKALADWANKIINSHSKKVA